MVVGITYGKATQLNGHYKAVAQDYDIYIGEEFWYRLTGYESFYYDLIDAFSSTAYEVDGTKVLSKNDHRASCRN